MKKIIFAIIVVMSSSFSFANSFLPNMCLNEPSPTGGDLIPWPWGSEIRFPWARIQGVWAPLSNGDCGSYFIFQKSAELIDGKKVVRITQYDPQTCQKLSSGLGIESNRVIRALMSSSKKSFELSIRAFDTSVVEKLKTNTAVVSENAAIGRSYVAKSVIVISLYPRDKFDKNSSYQLEKIQSTPDLICHQE